MLKLINKNKILSGGGEKSDRGGKWGWRGGSGGEGRERGERGGKGGKGEGSGDWGPRVHPS